MIVSSVPIHRRHFEYEVVAIDKSELAFNEVVKGIDVFLNCGMDLTRTDCEDF